MDQAGTVDAERPLAWRVAVALIVVTVVGVTAFLTWRTSDLMRSTQHDRLTVEAARIDTAVQERLHAYEQVLLGGLGLFTGSSNVSRAEWSDYVAALDLDERYPGFKSLTFSPVIPADRIADFVAAVRREPVPPEVVDPKVITEYSVRPPSGATSDPQPLAAPILYTAPFTPENQLVLGFDPMQEPDRRAALERASSTGQPVVTSRIRMAGLDPADARVGFIAYLPVKKNGVLIGWLSAAFRAESFMSGLLGDVDRPLDFEIEDGEGNLLYSTSGLAEDGSPWRLADRSALNVDTTPELSGTEWHIHYVARVEFATTTEKFAPWAVAIGGTLLTLLLTVIASTGAGWRRRAFALQRSEARVRYQATHDPLTGLANRSLFLERVEAEALAEKRFALAYVDIDGFKQVNDEFGHRAGDALLEAIAGRMTSRIRKGDIVARIGGDEFGIVMADPERPPRRAIDIVSDLVTRLGQPYSIKVDDGTVTVSIGASIGISCHPADGSNADDLVHAADRAMLAAKRAGRGRYKLARDL